MLFWEKYKKFSKNLTGQYDAKSIKETLWTNDKY